MVKTNISTIAEIECESDGQSNEPHRKSRRSQSLDRLSEQSGSGSKVGRKAQKQLMSLVQSEANENAISEKDNQIETLIQRVTTLHALNNEFASEHEKQQRELQALQAKMKQFDEAEAKGCNACRTLSDRAKSVQGKLAELEQQNRRLQSEVEHLTDDNYMLKVLVFRLNAQLESCQQTLRSKNADVNTPKTGGRCTSSSTPTASDNILSVDWSCLQSNVLVPLLNAYHETIAEKSGLIQHYDEEMIRMAGRLKDIIADNEQAHMDLEQWRRKSDDWLTERTRLQAQLDAYRNKVEIHTRRADVAKEKLVEIMRAYEQKLQTQAIDVQRLQELCNRLGSDKSDCHTMHQQPELMAETLRKYQTLLDGYKTQKAEDKRKFEEEIGQIRNACSKAEAEKTQHIQRIAEQQATIDAQSKKVKKCEIRLERVKQQFLRVRQSRSLLKDRLKGAITWNRKIEAATKPSSSVTWQDLYKVERLLYQKEVQLHQVRVQHAGELEKLQRKLHRRDELLRKVFINKVKPSKCK